MESFSEKNTLERTNGFFCCDEMYQKKPANILERRKLVKIKDYMHKIQPVQFGREITLPTSSILKKKQDENYTFAKKAFLSLAEKHIIYEGEEYWTATPIITKPKISKKEGIVTFLVFDEIWKCILDFTKGYRKYELATAMSFKSVYSM